jgi:hypothetical protein
MIVDVGFVTAKDAKNAKFKAKPEFFLSFLAFLAV